MHRPEQHYRTRLNRFVSTLDDWFPMQRCGVLRRVPWLIVALGTMMACATSAKTHTESVPSGREVHFVTRRDATGGYRLHSYDAEKLFRQGTSLLRQDRCYDAVLHYDHLTKTFPSSRYVSPALYNAGLCLEQHGKFKEAAEYFELLVQKVPESDDAKHARLRLLGLEIQQAEHSQALDRADALLADTALTVAERAEVMAYRAQALLALGRFNMAERQGMQVLDYYESAKSQDGFGDLYFVAAANFVMAEVLRTRSELVELDVDTREAQRARFQQRVELLLQAQKGYLETIRWAVPHWAVAAGYRIGRMYELLWQDMLGAPAPSDLTDDEHSVYQEELKELVRPLIRHAIRYWELTLRIIERTGVRGSWTQKTRAELERVRAAAYQQWLQNG